MKPVNEELARCALINFGNLERAFPLVLKHPFYVIAKGQLNEALDEGTLEEFGQKHRMRPEKKVKNDTKNA